MNSKLSKALDRCIARLKAGESIEQCLADYPDIRGELEELLQTYSAVSRSPRVVPSAEFRFKSKSSVMAEVRRMANPPTASDRPSFLKAILTTRKIVIPVGIAVVLVIAVLVSQMFGLWSSPEVLAQPCVLTTLSGDVLYAETGSDVWQSGTDGQILESGSRVQTGAGAYALLTFFDGSTITLEPGASLEIKDISQVGQQDARITVKQLSGETWSNVAPSTVSPSHFLVETPSAEISVQGTLFTVAVDASGATQVAATEGTVTVTAQKREVRLAADQQTNVSVGSAPALPAARIAAENKLLIAVDLPGVISVRDLTGASTGYFPNGVSFNQITGSTTRLLNDNRQLITIPQPGDGRYVLAVRNTEAEPVRLIIAAVSGGRVVYKYQDEIGGAGDGDAILYLKLDVETGRIVGGKVTDIEPMVDQLLEKVVVTDRALENAAALKNKINAVRQQRADQDEAGTSNHPETSSENTTVNESDESAVTDGTGAGVSGSRDEDFLTPDDKPGQSNQGHDGITPGPDTGITNRSNTDNTSNKKPAPGKSDGTTLDTTPSTGAKDEPDTGSSLD